MEFNEICQINSPTEYNHELDAFLAGTRFLPKKLIYQIYDGYSYGNVTTVQWAIKKLLILRTRIVKNETIEVEAAYPLNNDSFNQWIKELFPDIYDEVKIGCNGSAEK